MAATREMAALISCRWGLLVPDGEVRNREEGRGRERATCPRRGRGQSVVRNPGIRPSEIRGQGNQQSGISNQQSAVSRQQRSQQSGREADR